MEKVGGARYGSCASLAALLAGAAFSLSLASTAIAQDAERVQEAQGGRDAPPGWRFTIGAGVGVAPDYEGSDDYEMVPIPVLRADWDNRFVELFGFHLTSNVINHPNWRLGPSFNYRGGYTGIEDDNVRNLQNRGDTFEGGLKGGYVLPLFEESSLDMSIEWLHGLGSSGHEGWVLNPSLTFASPITNRLNFTFGADFEYASGNYMSHFFSVNSAEAVRSSTFEFDADANAKNIGFNGSITYEFTERWGVTGLAEYKRMLSNAHDSPVVDQRGSSDQAFVGVFVSYSW